MSTYAPFVAAHEPEGHVIRWTHWDGDHLDTASVRWENEGFTVNGHSDREQIDYVMRLSPSWQIRQFLLFRDLDEPDLWLATDGHGRWGEMNGAHRTELDDYADRVIAAFDEVAPGFRDSILHRQVIGPYDMEHTYGLVGGNIFHGELSPSQLFHLRPAAGYADYRTPIRGLYQASSATHGGGGVTGIPGLKVVETIAADRRRLARR